MIDQRAESLLDQFIEPADPARLDRHDWARFHAFLASVHEERMSVTRDEVINQVFAQGWPASLAESIAIFFDHGMWLLEDYDAYLRRRGLMS
jgi:hypothetical protein